MAGFLAAFDTRLATYLTQLDDLQERNQKHHAFQPTFWQQNQDFNVAHEVFVAAAGAIGHTVTKFSLVYSKTPSKEEGASICEALDKPCEQLLAATNVALFCGAGPSLATEIINDALRLIKSVHDLAKAIEKGDLTRVPQLTGRVWEYSTARVSKSNCVASKRSMLQCITMLNSTVEELKEFLDEQNEEDSEAPLDEVEQDDDFAFDSSLSEEERTLFEGGVKLLSMCAAIMKRGVLTIKKLTISDDQAAFLSWTAKLDVSYTAAQDAVVDFGAALYPPVGVDELSEAVSLLERTSSAILACLKEQPELATAEESALLQGETAFAKQLSMVKSQIEASHSAMEVSPTDLVSGFSVWAVPEATTAQELSGIIKEYAGRLQTPEFLPHMTVLSGVKGLQATEATTKLAELAASLRPLDVEIQTVAIKELYFQCVFGLLALSSELSEAHGRAKEVFATERKEEFMPHVSFIYGELDMGAREEFAKELRPRLDGKRMKMEKLQLWCTLGPVESWELVAEEPLRG
ncbi:hypothetical protein PHYBOEH_011000 [Phytophthora boehmeriae]|uniref:Cyclin-D1-binding protein 1-like N-terminal domain-containing protein n=1 Tax=Phytophthora boehmeriae TaxID=109152 RepID=A0A8T1X7Q1_9STRA|nr:hypothetical protein PHYBOEH_011000 [Phytophthora boehmeriae]